LRQQQRFYLHPVLGLTLPLMAILLLLLLGGCTSIDKPDLHRLYASSSKGSQQPPVVIVPGLMGSRLRDRDSGEEVWPGATSQLLFSSYQRLALEIDPDTLEPLPDRLEAYDITDQVAGQDFYGSVLRVLEQAGDYRHLKPGDPVTPGQRYYYVFPYDWRQDNALNARKLARFIERIQADFGDPELKVDIVAHSMGGLITRYYLRYGDVDTLDDNDFPVSMAGARHVHRVVLLGTPNLGSVEAFQKLITGQEIGLGQVAAEELATMPSIYQLLPHTLNGWLITAGGQPLQPDQFDIEAWRRHQWALFDPDERARIRARFDNQGDADRYLDTLQRYFKKRLERARRFSWSLTVPLSEPLPLIVFGGDCELTPARLVAEESLDGPHLRLTPDEISNPIAGIDYAALMLEPGDGTVTKASLLGRDSLDPTIPRNKWSYFPLDYAFFLCEPHSRLTTNVSFQDNLLQALLSTDQRVHRKTSE